MNISETKMNELLGRPLWQLTGEEYCVLMRYALAEGMPVGSESSSSRRQAIGVPALARELGCSASTLYTIKHYADFRPALISRIGRKEVFDVEKARVIANNYMVQAREERRRGSA